MHVFFIGIWMTVSDYNTNPTVIILVGIRIWVTVLVNEMHVSFIGICGLYQTIIPIPQ